MNNRIDSLINDPSKALDEVATEIEELFGSVRNEDGSTNWHRLGKMAGLLAVTLESDRLADFSLMASMTGSLEDNKVHTASEIDAEAVARIFDEIHTHVTASDVSPENDENRWHRFCFDSNARYYLATQGYVPEDPYMLGKELISMLERQGRA